MSGHDAAARYAALYAPLSEDLRKALPEVAVGLHAQLSDLSARPTVEGCDRVAINLAGTQTAVRKLREALLREGGSNGR